MQLKTSVNDHRDNLHAFSTRMARKWKNYFSLEGLIPGIQPTHEQKQVVQSSEKQLIIRGSAGSGKSLMLVYRLIKLMEQSDTPLKILYVTFNETLIEDTKKRLNQSQAFNELKNEHQVYIRTYHSTIRHLLIHECGYDSFNGIKITRDSVKSHESSVTARISALLERIKKDPEFQKKSRVSKKRKVISYTYPKVLTGRIFLDESQWTSHTGKVYGKRKNREGK